MQPRCLLACSQVLPSPTAVVTSVKAAARGNSRAGAAAYRGRNGLLGLEPPIAAASASARQPVGARGRSMQNGDAAWASPRRAAQGSVLARRPTLSMAAATPRGGDGGGGGSAAGGVDGSGTVSDRPHGDDAQSSSSPREGPELKARRTSNFQLC